MVLAAGLGTRLGQLGLERPKPLLPVADVPLIRYPLAALAGAGFGEVAVNLHHLGEQIVAELEGKTPGLALTFSDEKDILGTGGGLRQMGDWLTHGGREPFLVVNGKLVIDVDLQELVAVHRQSGALATMVVREVPHPEAWGMVEVDADGLILRIIGEGRAGIARQRTMFAGVHVVSPELLALLPPPGESSCVIRQAYLPALQAGGRIAAYRYEGYFAEHSTPARYLDGNLAVVRGIGLRHPPAVLTGIAPSALVDATVRLDGAWRIGKEAKVGAGARLEDVVVGAEASVAPGVALRSVVVWPGARVETDAEDAIVTRQGVFHVDRRAMNEPVPPGKGASHGR